MPERQNQRAMHVRPQLYLAFGGVAVIHLERQQKTARQRREVRHVDERLIADRALVRASHLETGDGKVVVGLANAAPVDSPVVGIRNGGEGAIGKHVDFGPGIIADQRTRRAQRFGKTVR